MKKRLFGTLLMGAMFIASMSMFTSCKDYDDDINSNKDAITELQKTAADLQSKLQTLENKHNEDIGKLNTAIQALQNEAATHATKKELQDAVSALEKSIADLTQIAATKEALQAVNDALEAKKADKTALEELQKTLAAADAAIQLDIEGIKKVDNDQNIAIAAAQKQLENQQTALDELKKALEGKASVEDLNKLAKTVGDNSTAIAAIQKKLEGIENVKKYIDDADAKLKSDLQKYATDADDKLKAELEKEMNKIDQKVSDLSKDIDILTLYVDRILNSIVLRPTNYVDGIECIDVPMLLYQDVLGLVQPKYMARGDISETWMPNEGKSKLTGVSDYHWISGLAGLIPTLSAKWLDDHQYLGYTSLGHPVGDPGISAITGNEYIHIIPAEGTEFDTYEAYESYQAHVYYNVNPNTPDLDGATFAFDVNYPEVTLATPATKAMYDEELIYPVNPDANSYDIKGGVMDVPFRVNLSEYLNFYAKTIAAAKIDNKGTTANGSFETYLGLNEQTVTIPFAAATITKENTKNGVVRSINSDWGAITPTFMHLTALADKNPDVMIAKSWGKDDQLEVTKNHLYRTALDARWGEATHEVVYTETFDLKDYIETHAAKVGTAFNRCGVLDTLTMKEMGLEYRYEYVDYTISYNNYATQQSKHTNPDVIVNGIVDPCGVDAIKGEPVADRSDNIASVGREPIVRVRLVHVNSKTGKEQTLLVGYVKLRIVKEKTQVYETNVEVQNEILMNCDGAGQINWYQIEDSVYYKMGLTKSEFDAMYELDTYDGKGANRFVKINNSWVNEADYVKVLRDQYFNTNMSLEELVESNIEFAQKYYTAFAGVVSYTNYARWTDDSEQQMTNLLYWNLGVANSANAHAFMDGSTVPADVDMKYVEYLVKPDINTGKSTKALTTTVRFWKKADHTAPLYVTLTIPAGKIKWATANLDNKSYAYWYKFNSDVRIDSIQDKSLAKEIHINLPQPGTTGTYSSTFQVDQEDFAFNLLKAFETQTVKWTVTNGKFSKWDNKQGNVTFELTYPHKGINAESDNGLKLDSVGTNFNKSGLATTWTVKSFSGTPYTLALAYSTDGKNFTFDEVVQSIAQTEAGAEIKHLKNDTRSLRFGNYIVAWDPVVKEIVPIVSLRDNYTGAWKVATEDYVKITETNPKNEFIKYYYNKVAEDILNYMGRTSDGYLTSSKQQLGEAQTFTAYLHASYKNAPCYEAFDPTYSNFFNARFERPVNFYPLQINVARDAIDAGAVVDFNNFILKLKNYGSASKPNWAVEKSAFTDWRGYYCIPTCNYATPSISKVYGKYYSIELDNGNGAATNFHGEAAFADIAWNTSTGVYTTSYKFTDDVRKIIKTDVYKVANDRKVLTDKSAINDLHFACNDATGAHEAVSLEVKDGKLIIYNNGINVNDFNLYVPIFYSYVLGDENEKYTYDYFRKSWDGSKLGQGMVWGVINVSNTHGNK